MWFQARSELAIQKSDHVSNSPGGPAVRVSVFFAKTQIQQLAKNCELWTLHWKGAQIKYLSLGPLSSS